MEGRPSRGRGGGWKRGGRGGNDSDSFGGEHRGRGRGGHHRGRGKRDHYRGRGRGGGNHAAEFLHRNEDGGDNFEEGEDNRTEVFSRRKLESNWDRYEESEKQGAEDEAPTQRGTDYHVLLESAGDSFTQFRFSEEKDWDTNSLTATQMSAVFVDLPALAQSLQQVPLHQRLNLEADLVQVSIPAELPATFTPRQEIQKTFSVPSATLKGVRTNQTKTPVAANLVADSPSEVFTKAAALPLDDGDEELDQLLSLKQPAGVSAEEQPAADETAFPGKVCEEVQKVEDEKMEKVKDEDLSPPKSASIRQEMTEEDLEDWLDSMIS